MPALTPAAPAAPSKHTPGPWTVSDGFIWERSPWNAQVRIAAVSQFPISSGIDSAANARLIAAAPDLLRVAGYAESFIFCFADNTANARSLMRQLRTAIASATGADAPAPDDERFKVTFLNTLVDCRGVLADDVTREEAERIKAHFGNMQSARLYLEAIEIEPASATTTGSAA